MQSASMVIRMGTNAIGKSECADAKCVVGCVERKIAHSFFLLFDAFSVIGNTIFRSDHFAYETDEALA